MNKKPVIIYTTPVCKYCNAAKEFFTEKEIPFTEINVGADPEARQRMITKSGQMGVPVFEVADKVVVGFNQEKMLERLIESGYVGN